MFSRWTIKPKHCTSRCSAFCPNSWCSETRPRCPRRTKERLLTITLPLSLRDRLIKAPQIHAVKSVIVCAAGTTWPGEVDLGPQGTLRVPATAMSKGLGSSGGVTLQKAKLDLRREVKTFEPKTDDAGGGGDIGKSVFNGGGGDGDDGDDDNDYFEEEDGDGDGDGDGFFRKVLPQLYDRVSISAVLEEWYRSFADLPMTLRRAVEMGLFSSAQLVRFCSMDVRPNIARTVSRKLPPSMSRSFVGRLMADPAFAQKLALENVLALCASLVYELRVRGRHFTDELDFVMINTLGLMAATSTITWLLAPSRSFGSMRKYPWQSMLDTLPNNIFDMSGPLRNYTNQSRVASLFAKFAQLSAVGAIIGSATTFLSQLMLEHQRTTDPSFTPSVNIPKLERSVLGMCAFVGLHAHLRYQALGGIDRYLFDHSAFLWSYMMGTTLFRVVNFSLGEMSRAWFQGLQVHPRGTAHLRLPSIQMHALPQTNVAVKSSAGVVSAPEIKKRMTKGFEMSLVSGTR